MRTILLATMLLSLAACQNSAEPEPSDAPSEQPSQSLSSQDGAVAVPVARQTSQPAGSDEGADLLDRAALQERDKPERVARYFTSALMLGDYKAAAQAWQEDQRDAASLRKLFGQYDDFGLQFGEGETEGAAGSLYYTAPVTLIANHGQVKRTGTITMRRVNDVPGATPEQLAWRITKFELND
ncbi:hypothetical protein [Altericroceibacterium endophyticum]|uniref:Uncharacterized protein n=1 Tax=Altericroceibacterium endophyticum TaxID=1808508 RepID=A0A6I4T5D3_9SPHN|nr:hypothetical protein [Altericroceibacterium endophyticum]MXO65888.1 hypothetical protein [Altericroceibacterium endophyticum]